MRARVSGYVVAVQDATYVNREGARVVQSDVYLQADDPRFGADRVTVSPARMPVPTVGEWFDAVCNFGAFVSKAGKGYLSVRAVAPAEVAVSSASVS